MADGQELPTETTTEEKVSSVVEKPKTESTVKNPDKLLEHYNAQKEEIKELKAFKLAEEKKARELEQKRLEEKGEYEALIPKKIEEATTPLQKQIEKLNKEKEELAKDLSKATSQFESLQSEIKTNQIKDATYKEFLAQDGSPKTSKEVFWKLYGDQVKVDETGLPVKLDKLFETIKADDFGASLFTVKVPEGTGTVKQTNTTKSKEAGPIVISQAEANDLRFMRRNGYTLEQISKGEVLIKD